MRSHIYLSKQKFNSLIVMLVLISSVLLLPSNIPQANAEQYLFQFAWGSSGSGEAGLDTADTSCEVSLP